MCEGFKEVKDVQLLLIGGMSQAPFVAQALREAFSNFVCF